MEEKEKTEGQNLEKLLTWEFPHVGEEAPGQVQEAAAFCEGYKVFLDEGKTERECVEAAVRMLRGAGYQELDVSRHYSPGDKVYQVNRHKALMATTFGERPMEEGLRINGAHIDSPRLDLKPHPLYEKKGLAYFKTHYYGGIRKYQWGTVPLAIHGVAIKKNGEKVKICIGEEKGDPVFCISDLLPHLAAKQNERKLSEGLKGEELNVIVGSLPYVDDKVKEPVKLLTLKLLYEKYGITEADFYRAEIEMVPAQKAADVGLDRSMVGAYGQDDRVCAYTALMAEMEVKRPRYTTVTLLADKEEIGSEGNTGVNSSYLRHYIEKLAKLQGANAWNVFGNSLCLSSDVNSAYDPTFSDAFEASNTNYVNKGCVLTKYTGARGKAGSNDASAETMARVIGLLEKEGVFWQSGEMGAVDQGGGGTIAKYIAQMDVDVVDLGVPVLSMHSPFELAAKLDIYQAYRAFRAFFEEEDVVY